MKRKPIADRFWPKVNKVPNGCWLWTGAMTKKGYGWFTIEAGCTRLAHRIAWSLTNGEIPDGLCILHRCDIPLCVNPEHLFIGTMKDNSQDMESKRRGNHPLGRQNGRSKLCPESVREIRRLYVPYKVSCLDLGKQFGVSGPTIDAIISGRTWRHVQ